MPCGYVRAARLPRRPRQVASAQQVQVQVEHGLPGSRAHVVDRSIAVLDAVLAADFSRHQLAIADNLRVFRLGMFQVDDMLIIGIKV